MRVLVTGASGWVGTPVVQDLLANGHQVLGLARSDKSADAVAKAGAQVHRGDVEDLESLRRACAQVDGVIHLAFNHDFSKFAQNAENDYQAITTMAKALGQQPLVITSGSALFAPGIVGLESMPVPRTAPNPRIKSEIAMEEMNAKGANVSVVRLPPTVHGKGDHGFVPMLVNLAREKGKACYIGNGTNSWSAVSRFDAAPVYRLGLQRAVAGSRYHAVSEEGVLFREITERIGRGLGLPVASLTSAEATDHFGWFAHFAAIDARTSSAWTRETLGWKPTRETLMQDMEFYF